MLIGIIPDKVECPYEVPRIEPGSTHARQKPYPLYYLSGPYLDLKTFQAAIAIAEEQR